MQRLLVVFLLYVSVSTRELCICIYKIHAQQTAIIYKKTMNLTGYDNILSVGFELRSSLSCLYINVHKNFSSGCSKFEYFGYLNRF